jgi:hypothetical protein
MRTGRLWQPERVQDDPGIYGNDQDHHLKRRWNEKNTWNFV